MKFKQIFSHFFSIYTFPHTSVGLTSCISIAFSSFEYFDSFGHYAAGWYPLNQYNSVWGVKYVYPCTSGFYAGIHEVPVFYLNQCDIMWKVSKVCTRIYILTDFPHYVTLI